MDEWIRKLEAAEPNTWECWLGYHEVKGGLKDAQQLQQLCDALRVTNSKRLGMTNNELGDENLAAIFMAAADNPEITVWNAARCNIGHQGGLTVADALRKAKHVLTVSLVNNPLSGQALEAITAAALSLPSLEQLRLADELEVEVTEVALQNVKKLRAKFPDIVLWYGPMGRIFEAALATRSISNEVVQHEVCRLQREMHNADARGERQAAVSLFEDLKQLSAKEHKRLEHVLTLLVDKYVLLEGYSFMASIESFDEYDVPNAVGQFLPQPLQKRPEEEQLRWLLAEASYREATFRTLCGRVAHEINAADNIMDLMTKYNIRDRQVPVETIAIHGCTEKPELNGNYVRIGLSQGKPLYRKNVVSKGQHYYLEYRSDNPSTYLPAGWSISRAVNSSWPIAFLREEGDCRDGSLGPCRRGWALSGPGSACFLDTLKACKLEATPCTHHQTLAEVAELVSAAMPFSRTLLPRDRSNEKVKLRFAPAKTAERAKQKGPKWLLDLNRATLEVDQPLTLIVAFYVLGAMLPESDGRITRITNKFTSSQMSQPCNLHVNFEVDSWVHEVQFTLSDFLAVKMCMHKYYQVERVGSASDVTMPLFSTLSDCVNLGGVDYDLTGSEMLPSSSRQTFDLQAALSTSLSSYSFSSEAISECFETLGWPLEESQAIFYQFHQDTGRQSSDTFDAKEFVRWLYAHDSTGSAHGSPIAQSP
eukprot:TRINITY_DN94355_c0_g1_i1.p1 TRINITY_DN94355_c0_g1~~TRINITY_DN94355_c0_g1_i1.p1  ORF type:complete len:706 (-),score=90.38 TRINITY_DN94355_c0_g1_i1:242-2359(-)